MNNIKMDDYNQIFNGGAGYASTLASIAARFGTMSQVEEFYHENGMATPGFQLNGISDNTKFQSEWDGLNLEPQITDALCWARLYGGSYVLAMVNDGRALTSAAKRGKPLESIVVYDHDSVSVAEEETSPRSPRITEVDYSALEVVMSCVHTGDRKLLSLLQSGTDMHCYRLAFREGLQYEEVYERCHNKKALEGNASKPMMAATGCIVSGRGPAQNKIWVGAVERGQCKPGSRQRGEPVG